MNLMEKLKIIHCIQESKKQKSVYKLNAFLNSTHLIFVHIMYFLLTLDLLMKDMMIERLTFSQNRVVNNKLLFCFPFCIHREADQSQI